MMILDKTSDNPMALALLGHVVAIERRPPFLILFYQSGKKTTLRVTPSGLEIGEDSLGSA